MEAGDRNRWRLANNILRDHPEVGVPYSLHVNPSITRTGNAIAHDADAEVRFSSGNVRNDFRLC